MTIAASGDQGEWGKVERVALQTLALFFLPF
jgi:hypothetical protein